MRMEQVRATVRVFGGCERCLREVEWRLRDDGMRMMRRGEKKRRKERERGGERPEIKNENKIFIQGGGGGGGRALREERGS